ncbi:MAG: hypothetical protein IPJ19_11535 [Planctomycetes bacterium]|nr:hypothetical protein [Planctomycetota bacterium]
MLTRLLACVCLFLASPQDPAPAPAPAPASEPELDPEQQLVADLQYALEEGESADFLACVDVDALLEKATAKVEVDERFRKGFCEGARESLPAAFHDSIQNTLGDDGSLHFLRIRTQRGRKTVLFRLLAPQTGVNYLEFSIRAGPQKQLRVDDWYAYTSGEWASETMHHLYLPFAMQQQRGLLDRLLGKDQLLVKHWASIAKITECAGKGEVERGLEIYRSLPEELRHDKVVLLQRLRLLAGHTENEDYLHLLEDLRRYCAGDPSNELHAIDYHYIRQEWRRAAEAVRRLRDSLDGDPYLDCLESTVLALAEDLPAAREAAERSIAGEAELLQAHWQLVSICLAQKDFKAVLAALERIDGIFELEWNDLTQSEQYKDFAASPQHSEWLGYLRAKPKR